MARFHFPSLPFPPPIFNIFIYSVFYPVMRFSFFPSPRFTFLRRQAEEEKEKFLSLTSIGAVAIIIFCIPTGRYRRC